MKKFAPFFALALSFGASLLAQPVLQMNVVPDIGDVATIQDADTLNASPGNAGANQTWNFGNLQPLSGSPAVNYVYLAPASTPPQYASEFPSANLAIRIEFDTVVYGYARKEATQFAQLGIKNDQIELKFTDPDIQLKPLMYGASFSDDFAYYTDAGSGVLFYSEGSRTVTYDGYGTLITPTGTYQNAMRLKSVSAQVDSTEFSGIKIINRTDITTYDWLVANQPGVFVSVYYTHTITENYFLPGQPPLVTDLGTTKSVNYQSGLSSGTLNRPNELPGIAVSIAGAHPAFDQLLLSIDATSNQNNLQLNLTDVNGRILESHAVNLFAGENRIDLPVGHLASGAYFLTLTDGKSVRTLPWQKR